MKLISLILLMITTFSIAEENYLNIDAKHFEANEKDQFMVFKGDVKMTKNKDILVCDNLLILTEPSKESNKKQIPKSYEATGKVNFEVHTKDNILKGKGDKVFYYPDEQKYIVVGNGYLEDTKEGKKLSAQTIYIDELTGHTRIDGDETKPVKFRMKLDNESSKQ